MRKFAVVLLLLNGCASINLSKPDERCSGLAFEAWLAMNKYMDELVNSCQGLVYPEMDECIAGLDAKAAIRQKELKQGMIDSGCKVPM